MTNYERSLYRAEIERLEREVARLRELLQIWQQAAQMDYASAKEVASGPQA